MSDSSPSAPPPTPADLSEPVDSPLRGSLISLLFWVCLLVSAALFAGVLLCDRLVEWSTLQREHDQRQAELRTLLDEVRHLTKLAASLRHDPQLAQQMTRTDFDAIRPGAIHIPVSAELAYDARVLPTAAQHVEDSAPWYVPIVTRIHEDRALQTQMLLVSGLLLLVGFTFLHENAIHPTSWPARPVRHEALGTLPQRLAARYRRGTIDV